MKRSFLLLAVLVFVVAIRPDTAPAQVRWQVGMRLGLSIFTGYNLGGGAANNILNYFGAPAASTSSTSAGLQIGRRKSYSTSATPLSPPLISIQRREHPSSGRTRLNTTSSFRAPRYGPMPTLDSV